MSALKGTWMAILCGAAFIAAPLVVSARPKSETTQIEKKTMQLDGKTMVDGKTLEPGKYDVLVDGNKVTFERNGRDVVSAPCDWKTMSSKSHYNSHTLSATNVLQELEFEGSNQALEVR